MKKVCFLVLLLVGCASAPEPSQNAHQPLPRQQVSREDWLDADKVGYMDRLDLEPGWVSAEPLQQDRPTLMFIHGAKGSPRDFFLLADRFTGRANITYFVYHDDQRLTVSADVLHHVVQTLPEPVVIIAHSMGALLPAALGGSESAKVCRLRALYLNPLIGGSRHADGMFSTGWHSPLYPLMRPLVVRGRTRDVKPKSDFQQSIFGPQSQRSCFAHQTIVLITETEEHHHGIRDSRLPKLFGRTREQLIDHLGRPVYRQEKTPDPHHAPLDFPGLTIPLIEGLLEHGL